MTVGQPEAGDNMVTHRNSGWEGTSCLLSLAPPSSLLAPYIQRVPALSHQFLYIVHGLRLIHVPILSHNLIESVLHVPGHVAGIPGKKRTVSEVTTQQIKAGCP